MSRRVRSSRVAGRGRRPRLGSESGLALLSALLTVALLTVIVVEMADSTLVHAHLARNAGNALAAQLLARSAVVGAEALLIEDKEQYDRTSSDHFWAMPFAVPTRNGSVAFQITDEGGKLDLNQVKVESYRKALGALFEELDVDTRLLDAVQEWIDDDADVAAAAVSQYCALPMPCEARPKPRKLASLEELRLIRGFDDRVLRAIRPYVTALPQREKVNVNTADPVVLRALGCELRDAFERPPDGFEKVSDVEACKNADGKLLGVTSNIFSIEAIGSVGDVNQRVLTIVSRKSGKQTTRHTWRERPVSDLTPPEVP